MQFPSYIFGSHLSIPLSWSWAQSQGCDKFKGEYVVKKFSLIKYLFMNNLEFPMKEQYVLQMQLLKKLKPPWKGFQVHMPLLKVSNGV